MSNEEALRKLRHMQLQGPQEELRASLLNEFEPGNQNRMGHTPRDTVALDIVANPINESDSDSASEKLAGLQFESQNQEELLNKLRAMVARRQ